jgi:hypothetical protein
LVFWAFNQLKGDPLAAGQITKADQILPYFVLHQLPAGLSVGVDHRFEMAKQARRVLHLIDQSCSAAAASLGRSSVT